MEEPKNSNENPIIAFFANLINAIKIHFPQKKESDDKVEPAAASSQAEPIVIKPAVVEDESEKPAVVTFPKQSFTPVKLEAEAEDSERSTNPVLLWQVYAIGGFFILRWAWTRWNERKGQKKPDDEPPPSTD
ncbi:hypothetical protein BUALT_Bualt01G0093200 [Buddleja alternifolia]|uniref:Uncharacterized protein n=1 Tax=Buddleja alternifolia TaxID=168488 RepID=A0AAV6Y5Q5_9LAMI|nr:hypothetical protein BUALT_Bualt01G0093200 [Buddleja alternifolia]